MLNSNLKVPGTDSFKKYEAGGELVDPGTSKYGDYKKSEIWLRTGLDLGFRSSGPVQQKSPMVQQRSPMVPRGFWRGSGWKSIGNN